MITPMMKRLGLDVTVRGELMTWRGRVKTSVACDLLTSEFLQFSNMAKQTLADLLAQRSMAALLLQRATKGG